MEIHKITYSDGSESVFERKGLEYFQEKYDWRPEYHFRNQIQYFEESNILPHLRIDLEDWAKNKYNLIDEDDQKELADFSNREIEIEVVYRKMKTFDSFENENICNQNFLERFVEIVNRGNDAVIDSALETLEKTYHIK